jgi:hypothetical protein
VKSRDTAVKALREVEQALKAIAAVPEGDYLIAANIDKRQIPAGEKLATMLHRNSSARRARRTDVGSGEANPIIFRRIIDAAAEVIGGGSW